MQMSRERNMTAENDPSNFVPAMEEDGQCLYCGGPTVNVGFDFITCGAAWNHDCFGHQVRTPVRSFSSERIMAAFDKAIDAIKRA
jgi:hypothetical protein